LDILIKQHKLRPKNIYNFDESGFMLGEGKKQNIITANPSASEYIATGDRGQSLTAIECIAADGWVMSPFFLFAGE
jgi:hypothetical protein